MQKLTVTLFTSTLLFAGCACPPHAPDGEPKAGSMRSTQHDAGKTQDVHDIDGWQYFAGVREHPVTKLYSASSVGLRGKEDAIPLLIAWEKPADVHRLFYLGGADHVDVTAEVGAKHTRQLKDAWTYVEVAQDGTIKGPLTLKSDASKEILTFVHDALVMAAKNKFPVPAKPWPTP